MCVCVCVHFRVCLCAKSLFVQQNTNTPTHTANKYYERTELRRRDGYDFLFHRWAFVCMCWFGDGEICLWWVMVGKSIRNIYMAEWETIPRGPIHFTWWTNVFAMCVCVCVYSTECMASIYVVKHHSSCELDTIQCTWTCTYVFYHSIILAFSIQVSLPPHLHSKRIHYNIVHHDGAQNRIVLERAPLDLHMNIRVNIVRKNATFNCTNAASTNGDDSRKHTQWKSAIASASSEWRWFTSDAWSELQWHADKRDDVEAYAYELSIQTVGFWLIAVFVVLFRSFVILFQSHASISNSVLPFGNCSD